MENNFQVEAGIRVQVSNEGLSPRVFLFFLFFACCFQLKPSKKMHSEEEPFHSQQSRNQKTLKTKRKMEPNSSKLQILEYPDTIGISMIKHKVNLPVNYPHFESQFTFIRSILENTELFIFK